MKKQIPIEEYHAHPAISKSKLDQINKSMLHYLEPVPYETNSLIIGSAVHDAILSPDVFESNYILQPETIKVRRGKQWDEFQELHAGKTVMKQKEFDVVRTIRDRVYSHPIGKNMFNGGEPEMSYFNKAEYFGTEIERKCRPDYVNQGYVFDLKTTRDASKRGFQRSLQQYRYHVQAAFYMDVLNDEGMNVEHFTFICVETSAPYPIAIYLLDADDVQNGREDYIENIKTLIDYNERKYVATGYTDEGVDTITMPAFYYYDKMGGV